MNYFIFSDVHSFYMENIEKMSIDDKIEYWHTHETGNSLIEFLGMTEQEYLEFCLPKQAIKDGENYLVEKGGGKI